MSFSGLVQTRDGEIELAKAEMGELYQLTHFSVGDGFYKDSFTEKTQLENEIVKLPITRVTRKKSEVILECDFDSKTIPRAFFFREIGIYANGKLCYYDNAGTGAEYLDPESEQVVKQKRIRIIVKISSGVNISTTIAEGLYVLQEEFDAHMEAISDEWNMENLFFQVFTNIQESDQTAMTAYDVNEALSAGWNGESSQDPEAMDADDVENAIATRWNGESSPDQEAMTAEDVDDATQI